MESPKLYDKFIPNYTVFENKVYNDIEKTTKNHFFHIGHTQNMRRILSRMQKCNNI